MTDIDLIKTLSRYDNDTRQIIRKILLSDSDNDGIARTDVPQKRAEADSKKA